MSDENGPFKLAEINDHDLKIKELDAIAEKYGDSRILVDFGHYIRARYKHFTCCGILKNTRDENAKLASMLEKFANGDNAGATTEYEKFKQEKYEKDTRLERARAEAIAGT